MDWQNIFYYDEASPTCLKWKYTRRNPKSNNVTALKDTNAGCLRFYKNGTPKNSAVSVNNRSYYIQRIIFELQNNCKIPEGYMIDHVDGNPHNNKTINLKIVKPLDNAHNVKKMSHNVSGITGVTYCKSTSSWRAFWHNGKGKQISKSFSVNKYGETIAKQLATDARNNAILELTKNGYLYTERHGK